MEKEKNKVSVKKEALDELARKAVKNFDLGVDAGWWKCFEEFSLSFLKFDERMLSVSWDVLKNKDLSKKEISQWLETRKGKNDKVTSLVAEYLESLDDSDMKELKNDC